MADPRPILADLDTESRLLDAAVSAADADWSTPTPAAGWTVAHQIAHLAWTDAKALLAVRTPEAFPQERSRAVEGGEGYVDAGAAEWALRPRPRLLADWRAGRQQLADVLAERAVAAPDLRLPWYGPPMSIASMATARLMETWAHGQDVHDVLGTTPEPSDRLRHIARLGVRTRDFAFAVHGLTPPAAEFLVELQAPDGGLWSYGPKDAEQRVTGSALDFCLLVTQRRAPADTGLRAVGADAERWLRIAQAFAGPPGAGRGDAGRGGAGRGSAGSTGESGTGKAGER